MLPSLGMYKHMKHILQPLIVCLRVNQELCYSSLIYGPTAFLQGMLLYFMFQTSLTVVFRYALSNSLTVHILATAWFLVRQPINHLLMNHPFWFIYIFLHVLTLF